MPGIAAAVLLAAALFEPPPVGSYDLPAIDRVGEHALVDSAGAAASLPGVAPGEAAVIAFVFTRCADVCPLALAALQSLDRVLAQQPELARRTRLVSVSIDPAWDTPARMAELRAQLAPRGRWDFLTGADAALLEDFGQDSLGDGRHVLKVFLVDGERRVRNVYGAGFLDVGLLRNDVATVLRLAERLLFAEGNRLWAMDLPDGAPHVFVENAERGGLDLNGMICPLPDASGRFVLGEDTGQPERPAGWGVLSADGAQLGKLTPTARTAKPEPYGCAFLPDGRLATTEIGDPGWRANGQLLLWSPPFDRASREFCALATDLGTPTGVAVDGSGRIYVAASGRGRIQRFLPPFDCGAPRREVLRGPDWRHRMLTWSGLAFAPNGNLYAASVVTGRIAEYTPEGDFVRMILEPRGWLPPFETGTPQGLAVDAAGALYYADLDLRRRGLGLGPGPDGKIWRIGARGPEILARGLAFPDGLGVIAVTQP